MSTTGLVATAIALPSPAAAQTVRSYNIPAGSLADAINSFAEQSGAQILYDATLTQGRRSSGLQGRFGLAEGLSRLLAGSGVTFRQTGTNIFTLERAPQATGDGAIQLGPVRVEGADESSGTWAGPSITSDPAATEGTSSYKPRTTNTATKLALTPRETPQTVTVITRQMMDDFDMTSVDDALKAASGIFVGDRGNNGGIYFSRGFELQSQFDGVPNPAGISEWNQNPQIDSAFLDRVELLQGASGLMSGAGYPGGTINLVRKRPTKELQILAEGQVGSWDHWRAVGDVSGPLLETGALRARVVGVLDNSDSFVDYAYRDRRAVYGVVEADLTPTTTLAGIVQYQQDKGRNHFGVPFAGDGSAVDLPRSIYIGDPKYRRSKDYLLYTLELTQALSDDWDVKAVFTHSKSSVDIFRYSYTSGELDPQTGDGLTLVRMRNFYRDVEGESLDIYANGFFDLFGQTHNLVFGMNTISRRDAYSGTGYSSVSDARVPFNVYDHDFESLNLPPLGNAYSGEDKITQLGFYGVGRFSLSDSLKLITGMRVSNYKDRDTVAGTVNAKENGVLSPYAGLIYDFSSQFSAYVSYSDIFQPQTSKSISGGTVKPVVGSNYEAGIKGELFDGHLNVAAAAFRLEQTNLAKVDDAVPYDESNVCGGFCYVAADKVRSQGIDLSANGEPLPGWSISAGYTYTDSEYASGTGKGEQYAPEIPRHSTRLTTAYTVPGTGFTFGGNLAAYSKASRSGTSSISRIPYTIRQDGYVLVGLMARYEISPQAEVSLVVDNLLDHKYITYLGTQNYSTFGEPRQFTASVKLGF